MAVDLSRPEYYINRELSWLDFNRRVMEEARDERNPLLERVRFLGIVADILDEFFEVRVAGILQVQESGGTSTGPDRLTPEEQLAAISRTTHELVAAQYRCWNEELLPAPGRREDPPPRALGAARRAAGLRPPLLARRAGADPHPHRHRSRPSLSAGPQQGPVHRCPSGAGRRHRRGRGHRAAGAAEDPGPARRRRRRRAHGDPGRHRRPLPDRSLRGLPRQRPRRLPRHPQLRALRQRGGGRQPARGDRRVPGAASQGRRGPPRDRGEGAGAPGELPHDPVRGRRGPRLHRRRPGQPQPHHHDLRPRQPAGAQGPALHSAGGQPAGRARPVLREPARPGRPPPPPVRVVQHRHRLHPHGRARPPGAGDQADPLPHRRGLRGRAGADGGGRAGQGGRRPRGG